LKRIRGWRGMGKDFFTGEHSREKKKDEERNL